LKIIALHYITVTFIILLIITGILIITAIIFRIFHRNNEAYLNKKKDKLYPLLFEYLDGKINRGTFSQLVGNKKKDWFIFEELIFDLMSNIEGQEKQKLIHLLRIPVLLERHNHELLSENKKRIVEVCRYYEHIQFVNPAIVRRLEYICLNGTQLEAIAAASAMTGSMDNQIRARAILMLARRDHVSAMSILDILYKFHEPDNEQPELEGKYLEKVIEDDKIPPKNLAILIKGLADLDYIDQAPFIQKIFLNKIELQEFPPVIEAVIYALGTFYYIDAINLIRHYLLHSDPAIRKACITSLAGFGDPDDLITITSYLNDPDLTVRLTTVKALQSYGVDGLEQLKKPGNLQQLTMNTDFEYIKVL